MPAAVSAAPHPRPARLFKSHAAKFTAGWCFSA
jgi:hypothetical protein